MVSVSYWEKLLGEGGVFSHNFESSAAHFCKLSPYFISRAQAIQESSRDVSVISLSLIVPLKRIYQCPLISRKIFLSSYSDQTTKGGYLRQKSWDLQIYFGRKQFDVKQNSKSRAVYTHTENTSLVYDIQSRRDKSISFIQVLWETTE